MNAYRHLQAYSLFYAKRIVNNVLSSDYCINNRFYVNFTKQRILSRIKKYEDKFPGIIVLPSSIEIELTNNCNLDCVFCPNAAHVRKRGVMSFGVFKNIINQARDMEKCHIIISGFGESLLDKEIIEKLDYIYDKKVARFVELVTNGCFLTEKLCQALCERQLIDILSVSIDAADSDTYKKIHSHDLLDLIVQNLEYLKKVKNKNNSSYPLISVRFKNFSFNKGQFRQFINKFSPIVDEIRPYINISKWPESEIEIDSAKRRDFIKIPCPNLWEGIRINWNGDVVLCCLDYEGKVVLGNINEQTIVDIWNNTQIQTYRKKHIDFQFDRLKICKDCNINSNLIFPW